MADMTQGQKIQSAIIVAALLVSVCIIGSGLNYGSGQSGTDGETSVFAADNIESPATENYAQTMLAFVDQQIAAQEDVKDVRCWSSVNKIQTFISGMPVDTEAIGQRVECYVTLLDSVWEQCVAENQKRPVTADQVKQFLSGRFPDITNQTYDSLKSDSDAGFDIKLFRLEQPSAAIADYSDTIESWRLLQSWLLRKLEDPETQASAPFSDEALLELKQFLVVYDIVLLKRARLVAMEKKLSRVNVETMKEAFDLQQQGKAAH